MNPAGPLLIVAGMFYLVPMGMILMGIFSILWPRLSWSLNVARGIRGIEPTTGAVIMTRVGGVLACVVGAAFLLLVATVLFPIQPGAPIVPQVAPAAPK